MQAKAEREAALKALEDAMVAEEPEMLRQALSTAKAKGVEMAVIDRGGARLTALEEEERLRVEEEKRLAAVAAAEKAAEEARLAAERKKRAEEEEARRLAADKKAVADKEVLGPSLAAPICLPSNNSVLMTFEIALGLRSARCLLSCMTMDLSGCFVLCAV